MSMMVSSICNPIPNINSSYKKHYVRGTKHLQNHEPSKPTIHAPPRVQTTMAAIAEATSRPYHNVSTT